MLQLWLLLFLSDYIAAQQNLETTLALLQTRAAEAEEETEVGCLLDQWLNKNVQ